MSVCLRDRNQTVLERFSYDCRKTKTKVITEPIIVIFLEVHIDISACSVCGVQFSGKIVRQHHMTPCDTYTKLAPNLKEQVAHTSAVH